jgi:hypothetical protein
MEVRTMDYSRGRRGERCGDGKGEKEGKGEKKEKGEKGEKRGSIGGGAGRMYISGKISGLEREEVERKFAEAEKELRESGWTPVSPLKNGVRWGEKWERHMAVDILMMLECEGVFFQADWKESAGARLERCIAEEKGMTIYEMREGRLYIRIMVEE